MAYARAMHPPYVGVVGPGDGATSAECSAAETAGRLLAERGYVVVTGGLSGVMAAAARGVDGAGGTAVALLPGSDRSAASPGHRVVLPTGLGEMRNALLVRGVDTLLAIGGSWGTLSEIALAVRTGVPVFGVGGWDLPNGVQAATSVEEAVEQLTARISG